MNLRPRPSVLVLGAALVALAGAASGCGVAEAAAASVNGREVDRTEFERELRALAENPALLKSGGQDLVGTGERTVSASISAGWLNTVLQDAVITAEYERRKLSTSEDDRRAGGEELEALFRSREVVLAFPSWFRERVAARYGRAVALRNAISDVDLSDAGLMVFYEKNKDKFARVCTSHILVATEPEAAAVVAKLAAGEDFAALAMASSLDKGSAAKGGDLGTCTARGELVPEYEQVAFEIPVGTISDPVKSQFGFHVIKVRDRPVLAFADVKDQVKALAGADGSKAFGDFLRKALTDGDVSIDPRYGTLVTQPGQVPQVRPPAVPAPAQGRPGDEPAPPGSPLPVPPGAPGDEPAPEGGVVPPDE